MFNKIVNINYIITKIATVVPYTCMIMCTNFGKKQSTFAEVTLKNRMDPSSQTRESLMAVLDLRRLYFEGIHSFNPSSNDSNRKFFIGFT